MLGFGAIGELAIGSLPSTAGGVVWAVAQVDTGAVTEEQTTQLLYLAEQTDLASSAVTESAVANLLAAIAANSSVVVTETGSLLVGLSSLEGSTASITSTSSLSAIGAGTGSAVAGSSQDFIPGVSHSVGRAETLTASSLLSALLDAFVSRAESSGAQSAQQAGLFLVVSLSNPAGAVALQDYDWSTSASRLEPVGSTADQSNTAAQTRASSEPVAASTAQSSRYDAQVSRSETANAQTTQLRVLWIPVSRADSATAADLLSLVSGAVFDESRSESSAAGHQQSSVGSLNVTLSSVGSAIAAAGAIAIRLASVTSSAQAREATAGLSSLLTALSETSATASLQTGSRFFARGAVEPLFANHSQGRLLTARTESQNTAAAQSTQSSLANLLASILAASHPVDGLIGSSRRGASTTEASSPVDSLGRSKGTPAEEAEILLTDSGQDSWSALEALLVENSVPADVWISVVIGGVPGFLRISDGQLYFVSISDLVKFGLTESVASSGAVSVREQLLFNVAITDRALP